MTPLRCRTDLIELVARLAPSPGVRRACLLGTVEFLGSFDTRPRTWRLRITGPHGSCYLVLMYVDGLRHRYQICETESVPWDMWAGQADDEGGTLRSGDHPKLYAELRNQCLQPTNIESDMTTAS